MVDHSRDNTFIKSELELLAPAFSSERQQGLFLSLYSELILAVLTGPYGMPKIESGSAIGKANALHAVIALVLITPLLHLISNSPFSCVFMLHLEPKGDLPR